MKVIEQIEGLEVMVDGGGRVLLVVGKSETRREHQLAMCDHLADELGQALLRAAALVKELGLSCRGDHSKPDAEA